MNPVLQLYINCAAPGCPKTGQPLTLVGTESDYDSPTREQHYAYLRCEGGCGTTVEVVYDGGRKQ